MNLTLRQYLKNNDMNVSEGSLHNQKDQQNLLRKLIKGCRKGMQIGFNAGDSADLFLDDQRANLESSMTWQDVIKSNQDKPKL